MWRGVLNFFTWTSDDTAPPVPTAYRSNVINEYKINRLHFITRR